jgi:LAS superfamily LD-carboxypeptidase LdcB
MRKKKVKSEKESFEYIALRLALLLLLVGSFSFISNIDVKNIQVGQIKNVAVDILKVWQRAGGLEEVHEYGSQNREIALLQIMLSEDDAVYPEGVVTGYFGDLTKDALTKFQNENTLKATGELGEDTRIMLNNIFLEELCPKRATSTELLLRKGIRFVPLQWSYVPRNLVSLSEKVSTKGVHCLREDVVPYVVKMFSAAEKDGVNLMVTSGYRKPEIQQFIFNYWVAKDGVEAMKSVARPGASEHQLGTAIDVTDSSIGNLAVHDSFAYSDGYHWLLKNAHRYGFTLSYPKNKEIVTGYTYEPWHWRFVGVPVATVLFLEGKTFAESSFGVYTGS